MNNKIDAIRLAKELYPNAAVDDLIRYATSLTAYLNYTTPTLLEFISNCYIQHPTKGLIHFEPYQCQIDTVGMLTHSRRTIINTSRQIGTSTLLTMVSLWKVLTTPNHHVLYIGSSFGTVSDLRLRVKSIYDSYTGFKPGLVTDIKTELAFANGSKIIFNSATKYAGLGRTIDTLVIDNAAYISYKVLYELWESIMPCLFNSQIIVSSTPNEPEGLFYDLWSSPNEWLHVMLPWDMCPGRDDTWKTNMKLIMDDDQFNREFNCQFIKRQK